jgi:hypothetical protein
LPSTYNTGYLKGKGVKSINFIQQANIIIPTITAMQSSFVSSTYEDKPLALAKHDFKKFK